VQLGEAVYVPVEAANHSVGAVVDPEKVENAFTVMVYAFPSVNRKPMVYAVPLVV
jgi:hypothetical protein